METHEPANERSAEFARLADALRAAGIPFLLVGGLALSAHHYERTTQDVDFFCRKALFPRFDATMKNLGYELLHEPTELYVRYSQRGLAIVDFIFADEATFSQMEASARDAQVLGVPVRVPCLEHLLAMKLFALEQGKRLKDMGDISELVRANGINVQGEVFEKLCLKFASAKWLTLFREMK
jgi:hypothetical protein